MPTDRLERIRAMLTATPDDAFLNFALAQELRNRGDAPAAVTAFRHLRRLHPDYTGLYYHLAQLLVDRERPSEAEEVYTAGIALAERQRDLHALAELRNAYTNWSLEREG